MVKAQWGFAPPRYPRHKVVGRRPERRFRRGTAPHGFAPVGDLTSENTETAQPSFNA